MSDPSILSTQQDRPYSGTVDAGGNLTLRIRPKSSASWEVTQVTTEMPTAPSGSLCVLRKNGNKVTDMISTGDAASGDPSVVLRPSDELTIEWTQCTPGDTGRALVFYNQYGRR
jgi:hypothetical protein